MKPCPGCGGPVPDDTVWIRHDRFFCSEKCCAEAPVMMITSRPPWVVIP